MDRSNSGQSDAVASQIQRMRRPSRGELVGKVGEKEALLQELKPKKEEERSQELPKEERKRSSKKKKGTVI